MFRSILLPIPVLFLCMIALAQEPVKVDYDYANRRVTFEPLLQQLTKEDRYALQMPTALTYYGSQAEIKTAIYGGMWPLASIRAKLNMVSPDYTFQIAATGVKNIVRLVTRNIKTYVYDKNGTATQVSGLVRDYTCNFPCELIIKDKTGKEIRTVTIADDHEVFTTTVHKDFLTTTGSVVNPFYSELTLTDYEKHYDLDINKRIEYTIAAKVFTRALQAIAYLYDSYSSSKETYGYGYVKPKNRPYDYSDLDSALTWYKTALDSMHVGNNAVCKALCQKSKEVMQKALESDQPRIDKNVRTTIIYTLGFLNLLTQHFEEAWKDYHIVVASGYNEEVRMSYELKDRISQHEYYYKLKSQIGK